MILLTIIIFWHWLALGKIINFNCMQRRLANFRLATTACMETFAPALTAANLLRTMDELISRIRRAVRAVERSIYICCLWPNHILTPTVGLISKSKDPYISILDCSTKLFELEAFCGPWQVIYNPCFIVLHRLDQQESSSTRILLYWL